MELHNSKASGRSAGVPSGRLARFAVSAPASIVVVFIPMLVLLQFGCGIFRNEREWEPKEAMPEELCFASNLQTTSPERTLPKAVEGEAFGLSGRPAAVAAALGLFPLLAQRREILEQDEGWSAGSVLRALTLERRIASHLTLASLNLTAVSARVACEGNRARELADSLDRNKNRREDRRTIAAILTGAATNLLTGIFSIVDMAVTGGGIGIAGGLAQYGIRGAVEEVDIFVDFRHPRNFLRDFWDAPRDPDLFPAAVWEFLTYRTHDRPSLREQTLAQWKVGRNITDDQSEEFKERYGVLFDTGGTYNVGQLKARAAMLELLRSSIELMHGDLAVLVERLELESEALIDKDGRAGVRR